MLPQVEPRVRYGSRSTHELGSFTNDADAASVAPVVPGPSPFP